MQSFQHYVDDLVHFVQHTRKARPELNDCPTFLLVQSSVVGCPSLLSTWELMEWLLLLVWLYTGPLHGRPHFLQRGAQDAAPVVWCRPVWHRLDP